VRDSFGPGREKVGVGDVVHEVDLAAAGWPGRDLAEHHLAIGLAVPLHVSEPVAEAEHPQDGSTERPAALKIGCVQVAQRDIYGADPLVHFGE